MQVNIETYSPVEIRIIAECLARIADERQKEMTTMDPVPPVEQVEKKPRRAVKQMTAAEAEQALSNGTVGESTASADTAPEADESADEVVPTHDLIRTLFGKIQDQEKRSVVVKGIKALGATAIKDIPADKLASAYALVIANG